MSSIAKKMTGMSVRCLQARSRSLDSKRDQKFRDALFPFVSENAVFAGSRKEIDGLASYRGKIFLLLPNGILLCDRLKIISTGTSVA